MKRIIILFVIFVVASVQCYTQPTLTYSGNAPQIGDIYNLHFVDAEGLSEGGSGANQVWSYTDLSVIESSQTTVMDPSATPFAADFPEANAAFLFEAGNYTYAVINTNYVENVGIAAEESGIDFIIHYTNPVRIINFPFAYGNSYTDDYQGNYTMQMMTVTQSGTRTFTADAYGTLTTPEGTFNDVLRVKSVHSEVDSFFMGTMFLYANTGTIEDYAWYTNSAKEPLFNLTYYTNSVTGTDTTAYYSGAPTFVPEPMHDEVCMKLYPVPAEDRMHITLSSGQTANLNIYDISGKKVFTGEGIEFQKDDPKAIDVSGLAPGTYFIHVHNQNLTVCRKFLKK